jgi:hypothetical protein
MPTPVLTRCKYAGYTPFDRDSQQLEMEAIIAGNFKFEPGKSYSMPVSWISLFMDHMQRSIGLTCRRLHVALCATVSQSTPTCDRLPNKPYNTKSVSCEYHTAHLLNCCLYLIICSVVVGQQAALRCRSGESIWRTHKLVTANPRSLQRKKDMYVERPVHRNSDILTNFWLSQSGKLYSA